MEKKEREGDKWGHWVNQRWGLKEGPQVVRAFLTERSLTANNIESYNSFLENTLQATIDAQGTIEPEVEGITIKLGKIRLERPTVIEADGTRRPLLPMEARMRDLTYAANLYLQVTPIIDGKEGKSEEVLIGELPVMIKSTLCYLNQMNEKELIEAGEDPRDPGGYFIINGTEKVLMNIEDLAPNRILTTSESSGRITRARVFSTRAGFRGRCTVDRTNEGLLWLTLPGYARQLELMLALKALGLAREEKILAAFSERSEVRNDILLNLEACEVKNTREALETIGKRAAPSQPIEYQLRRAEIILDHYLLPHIGIESSDRLAKARYLCKMAERAILVAHGLRRSDDKDNYANKRIKNAGKLMEELFRYAFTYLIRDAMYQIQRAAARSKKINIFTVFRPDALSDRIRYSMATGNWVGGYTGVVQPLDRTNFTSAIFFMRRVTSPLAKKHPHFKARDVHGTAWGRLDPNETPEGQSCGLIKSLALMSEISTAAKESKVEAMLKRLGVAKEGACEVYLNGRSIGFVANGERFASRARELRRRGTLPHQVNVRYDARQKEVVVNSDEGRLRRPLLVVKGGRVALTKEQRSALAAGKLKWSELLHKGIVEYLDADEEENAYIACSEDELTQEHTHLEIDATAILGFNSSLMPYLEHNMATRILMAAQHLRQSLGLPWTNYNLRSDTRAFAFHYPQAPLVKTKSYHALALEERPSGQNLVVAILSYDGYNMHDAIVINKSAIDRGAMRSTFFRSYACEERRYPGGQKDKLGVPEEYVQGFLGPEAYAHLDAQGVIDPERPVSGYDILVARTSPPRFLKEVSALEVEAEKMRESSLSLRGNEAGIVDGVELTETPAGARYIKIRVRTPCIPELGDKISARSGQKGVIGLVVPHEDMPFTASGIVPDIIINPSAIPSRMTAGHLIEMLAGKVACLDGTARDGTTFVADNDAKGYCASLHAAGFKENGEEVLYDGRIGAALKARIFVGVAYYERLYHLAALKAHARSRGPIQMLTHQPTEGRAREGGFRLGEMERDCLVGFGASALLKERWVDSGDRAIALVCPTCGSIGYTDKVRGKNVCPLCGSNALEEVETCYVFKLLLDEMRSLCIFPRLLLRERGA